MTDTTQYRATHHAAPLLLVLLLLCMPQLAPAQDESLPQDDQPVGTHLQIRSVLVDVEWALFMAGVSGSIDIDVFRFPSSLYSTVGLRLGVDHYIAGSVGGSIPESPFTDYNILLRHTGSGRVVRLDIYAGWSYYTTSDPVYHPPAGGFKFGIDLRLKVVDQILAGILKLSRPEGLGASLGWDR